MGSILGGGGAGNKRKRLRSPATAGRWVKSKSASNNSSVTCELFNGKGGCGWTLCKRSHKCKECGSRDHGLAECPSKDRKKSWCEAGGTGVTVEQVEIVEVASLANENIFCQFMRTYPCLPAPPRPNTFIKFRLADASKPSLTNSPSPLKPTVWATLLSQYLGGLRINLLIILRFGAELGYEGPSNTFILSNNLASALEDPTIIEKKLQEDLALGRVTQLQGTPTPPYICSPLGLVLSMTVAGEEFITFLILAENRSTITSQTELAS